MHLVLLILLFVAGCVHKPSEPKVESPRGPSSTYSAQFPDTHAQVYPYYSLRPDLGETLLEGEEVAVRKSAEAIEGLIRKRSEKQNLIGRGDHSTSHGCYPVNVTVKTGLRSEYSAGFTSTENAGKSFAGVARLSNAEAPSSPDRYSASLGFAMKVYLPAEKYTDEDFLLGQENPGLREQDFLSGTSRTFMVSNIIDYAWIFERRVSPGALDFAQLAAKHPNIITDRGIKPRLRTAKDVPVYMEKRFWGSLPYAWGSRVAKYSLIPCHRFNRNAFRFDHKDDNYQKTLIEDYLRTQPLCYDLALQLRPLPTAKLKQSQINKDYPVENAKVFWPSPFVSVARVTIEKNARQLAPETCEQIVFNPWNGLKDHQPLGSLSRGRLAVYKKSKNVRYQIYREQGVPK